MTPRAANRHDFISRQQFIDAQWKIAEARRKFEERFPAAAKLRLQRQGEELRSSDTASQLAQQQPDTN